MQYLKVVCGFLCFLILASNVWSMSRWSEARGVYDDICYLRQAHLFQRFGIGGLETDISRDDDHYLSSKLKEIGFPTWSDTATVPCHTVMPVVKKLVMQYPPGTGFVLALFPQGFQVIALPIGNRHRLWLCAAGNFLCALQIFNFAQWRLWLLGNLPDDQSSQGQLFGGANDGGVCASGLSHPQNVPGGAAAAPPSLDGTCRSLDRSGGQFQIAESASLVGYFLFWSPP